MRKRERAFLLGFVWGLIDGEKADLKLAWNAWKNFCAVLEVFYLIVKICVMGSLTVLMSVLMVLMVSERIQDRGVH